MKRCIRCNNYLRGKQRKYCSPRCSRQKEAAKYATSYKPVDEERKQKVEDYAAGKIKLSHEEKHKLWWNIESYRILFN